MSRRRFLVPPENLAAGEVLLPPAEAEHARKVLRLAPGEPVALLDGRGRVGEGEVSRVDRREVACRVAEVREAPRPRPRLVLCPGLLKGPAQEDLLVKLVELMADEVRPLVTRRTVALARDAAARLTRWERLCGQALKQSGNPFLPALHPPAPLAEVLARAPGAARRLMLYEDDDRLPLAAALAPAAGEVWALVGPEGGFAPEEVAQARAAGFLPCHLPGAILRAPTASLALAAVVRFGAPA